MTRPITQRFDMCRHGANIHFHSFPNPACPTASSAHKVKIVRSHSLRLCFIASTTIANLIKMKLSVAIAHVCLFVVSSSANEIDTIKANLVKKESKPGKQPKESLPGDSSFERCTIKPLEAHDLIKKVCGAKIVPIPFQISEYLSNLLHCPYFCLTLAR